MKTNESLINDRRCVHKTISACIIIRYLWFYTLPVFRVRIITLLFFKASRIYKDGSLGNFVNLSLVKIHIITNPKVE